MDELSNSDAAPASGSQSAPPSSDDTLRGRILALGFGAELTVWPFILGILGCGLVGYWIGADRFPGTGVEYALAVMGGFSAFYWDSFWQAQRSGQLLAGESDGASGPRPSG